MSEAAPHKSHATGWIIGVLVALVLYVGSAVPVEVSFFSSKLNWLPFSWFESVATFYKPADWVWDNSPLNQFKREWISFWVRTEDAGILDL